MITLEYFFEFPYKQEQWVRPKYLDMNDRIYNNAFLNPEVIRLRKKIIHSFIYETYDTGWNTLTGDVGVLIDIRCRTRCNLLFTGKNIIDALWSEYEQVIEDDKQIISARITQRHYKRDIVRIGINDFNNSNRRVLSFNDAILTFDTTVEPCEIILPEFRRDTDKFIFSSKNETAIQKNVNHLMKSYLPYERKTIRSPVDMSIEICSQSKRKDLDNIALLLVLALQRAEVLPDINYVKAIDFDLKRCKGMPESAVVKLVT